MDCKDFVDIECKAETIISKLHIKSQHIILVVGFCRNSSTVSVPPVVTDAVLFYYAKPLKMKIKHLISIKYILYCPIDDSWDSMMSKIREIFDTKYTGRVLSLFYGHGRQQRIARNNWTDLKWVEDELFMTRRARTIPEINRRVNTLQFSNSHYKIMKHAGRRSNHKAFNIETLKVYEIKLISKQRITKSEQHNLQSNISLLASFSHKNIVSYIEMIQNESDFGIVLEYVNGSSLASFMKQIGGFPEKIVASFVAQILCGLDFLHQQGIIHGNLRAETVLINDEGIVKLSNFGLTINYSNANDHPDSDSGIVTQTSVYWMAPEMIEMSTRTTTSDVWAVGATAIELFTGYPPYHNLPSLSALFRIISDMRPAIPPDASNLFRQFLCQCFCTSVSQRPSAKELQANKWLLDDTVDSAPKLVESDEPNIYMPVIRQPFGEPSYDSSTSSDESTESSDISHVEENIAINTVVNRAHIDLKHMILVYGFSKVKTLYIPSDVVDVILFYYAKPLLITLRYNIATKCILYCPIEDTFNSMIKKVKNVFHERYVYLRHKNYKRQIKENEWNNFKSHDDYLFDVDSSSEWDSSTSSNSSSSSTSISSSWCSSSDW